MVFKQEDFTEQAQMVIASSFEIVRRCKHQEWDVEHLVVLDDFPFCNGEHWISTECGHLSSTLMPDGSILTGYGNYLAGGVLIRWQP